MKIAVIGAAGNVGQRIVGEALRRGHEITALGPHRDKLEALGVAHVVEADINDPPALAAALRGHAVAVSAVRFARYDPDDLLRAVKQSGVPRLAVVGGAGSLRAPGGEILSNTPDFPEGFREEAEAGSRVLDRLRRERDLDWTFLSPSAEFRAGERTGRFRLGGDDLLVAADGKSRISFEDFAIAFCDEIETPGHSRRRFTVGY